MSEDWQMDFGKAPTNIAIGTSAERAYALYSAKNAQIANLEFECGLLVDRYFAEMSRARIPAQFRMAIVEDLFSKDKGRCKLARDYFLSECFSGDFLKKFKVKFDGLAWSGYDRTAAGITMEIGDYLYTIEIPMPQNIVSPESQRMLMGEVKFRADRIHKSKKHECVKELESVQMPTYDWKQCFEAIEADVEKESRKHPRKNQNLPIDRWRALC